MTTGQKTIIVVEDEQDAAEMFAEMMRVNGFRVLKATGCKPAMALIDREKPAAVILDIMMPDISGLEVLRYHAPQTRPGRYPGHCGISQKPASRHKNRAGSRGIHLSDQTG